MHWVLLLLMRNNCFYCHILVLTNIKYIDCLHKLYAFSNILIHPKMQGHGSIKALIAWFALLLSVFWADILSLPWYSNSFFLPPLYSIIFSTTEHLYSITSKLFFLKLSYQFFLKTTNSQTVIFLIRTHKQTTNHQRVTRVKIGHTCMSTK